MPLDPGSVRYIECTLNEALEEPTFFCTAKVYNETTEELVDVTYDFETTGDGIAALTTAAADANVEL